MPPQTTADDRRAIAVEVTDADRADARRSVRRSARGIVPGSMAFEAAALDKDGIAYQPVPPRYRTPYFSHIMGGYAAGYYAYIWSEVLDADTVEWIKQHGGLKRENGDRFRETLLSRGGSKDALELFRDFTGHGPEIEPLLVRRGLTGAPTKAPAESKKPHAKR